MTFVPKLRIDQYLSLLFISIGLFIHPWMKVSAGAESAIADSETSLATSQSIIIPSWDEQSAFELSSSLSAEAVIAVDVPSGRVLLVKNEDQLRYPASTTKLMTALVARQIYDLDYVLTVREEAFTQGNTMGLAVGDELSVYSLLQGLLIPSGNDAAFVLANNHPLGYEGFVAEMNRLARELKLDQTTFTNPSGLDQFQHQTSARDLNLLARQILKDEVLRQIVGTKEEIVFDENLEKEYLLKSSHALLGERDGVIGIKTGTTPWAKENLVTAVELEDREVLIVVMGSLDRYSDTNKIIDWIFTQVEWREVSYNGI